ncbi:MAG: hypothetical protein Q4D40_06355, partial [Eubacteriales bacterium]|nr:hypothetical protein [Eubacteriales bacterium]
MRQYRGKHLCFGSRNRICRLRGMHSYQSGAKNSTDTDKDSNSVENERSISMANTETLIARDLLSIGAVFFRPDEPFTWASGIKSPVYCDNRLTLTAPQVRDDVEYGLAELIREHYPETEVLMGTSTAGIAHAAITAHILNVPMGYVR